MWLLMALLFVFKSEMPSTDSNSPDVLGSCFDEATSAFVFILCLCGLEAVNWIPV